MVQKVRYVYVYWYGQLSLLTLSTHCSQLPQFTEMAPNKKHTYTLGLFSMIQWENDYHSSTVYVVVCAYVHRINPSLIGHYHIMNFVTSPQYVLCLTAYSKISISKSIDNKTTGERFQMFTSSKASQSDTFFLIKSMNLMKCPKLDQVIYTSELTTRHSCSDDTVSDRTLAQCSDRRSVCMLKCSSAK